MIAPKSNCSPVCAHHRQRCSVPITPASAQVSPATNKIFNRETTLLYLRVNTATCETKLSGIPSFCFSLFAPSALISLHYLVQLLKMKLFLPENVYFHFGGSLNVTFRCMVFISRLPDTVNFYTAKPFHTANRRMQSITM